jgi:hypothetical protein
MTTTPAVPAPHGRSTRDASGVGNRLLRRRAARASRRDHEQERRHDRAVHDDRYLDRTGIELSPADVAALWRR